jgi:hypothetical protein
MVAPLGARSAVFRDVDFLASEHGLDPRPQTGFLRQLHEQLEGFVSDAILRVIEHDAHRFGRHPLAARGIVREQRAEVQVANCAIVSFEALPGRAGSK